MYIAPEYFDDQHKKKSEKFDVYGFAISAWEILSQKRAHRAFTEPKLIKHFVQMGVRPDMEEINVSIPSIIKQLIKECWHTKPEDRPCFKFIDDQLFYCVTKIQPELQQSYISLTDQEKSMDLPNHRPMEKIISNTLTNPLEENRPKDTDSLGKDMVTYIKCNRLNES